MNRHQSNPFLAGWEIDDEVEPNQGVLNKVDSGDGGQSAGATTRRHSSSHSDDANVVNPFGEHRAAADRRLYHRNMSSFDAASSLQMEHQQLQLQENGDANQLRNQNDLIAKMTAEFQTAIETNDKQFGATQGHDNYDDDDAAAVAAALGNPFDPFETIVDDDVSIPSPATSAGGTNKISNQIHQSDENFFKPEESSYDIGSSIVSNRPQDIQLEDNLRTRNPHDSIDEDEDELVSTPVRNIKSSPPPLACKKENVVPDSSANRRGIDHNNDNNHNNSNDELDNDNNREQEESNFNLTNQYENTNSIAKASLFASLLASAEQADADQQKIAIDDSSNEIDLARETSTLTNAIKDENINFDYKDGVSPIRNIETATHVIKGGSHLAGDGQTDRSIGYFDPFETVIDKDAITSLMNEKQQLSSDKSRVSEAQDDGNNNNNNSNIDDQTTGADSELVFEEEEDNEYENNNSDNVDRSLMAQRNKGGLNAESASLETVVEKTTSADDTSKLQSLPRPTPKTELHQQIAPGPPPTPLTSINKPTSKKTSNKVKKKASFQEDSSDSSDSDDRIQIVIKARNISQNKENQQGGFVPLLPPPPSKSSMKQARERGQVEDIPSPVMSYKMRHEQKNSDFTTTDEGPDESADEDGKKAELIGSTLKVAKHKINKAPSDDDENEDANDVDDDDKEDDGQGGGQFVIPMTHSDEDDYGKPDTPLYDEDTSYVLEEYPAKYDGPGWEMMLRYPPKKKLTSNRFWKKIFVKLAQVPLASDHGKTSSTTTTTTKQIITDQDKLKQPAQQTCIALQIFDKPDDKKPMQEIPIQATYTVSEISSQQFDQFGKIFTLKLQYIFYKERVGVRQGQLARFIHTGHIGSSTTSGGHGVDPISIGAIKRMGAPIEHSPQISQIIKLGCASYSDIKIFKTCLEDYLFRMPIHRDRALSTYKTEEVQMAVRDETHLELNQVGTIIKQLARVRLFFLSFLNGTPIVEVGINDIHRQGREVVGRMDILPVVTEEWIRLEACDLHSTIDKEEFENPDSRIIKLTPPDATFFELLRFRIRPPRNRELPLQITANMSVTRTKVSINCDVMVPGCVSRKHGQIPCENIAIKVMIPECWIYFFREEKHFRMGSKKSVNRRPGKVKGIERFLGGGGLQDINDESSLIEVTSGQAKYEHHHHAIVWRAARWPKESQSAYVQNTMKIRLPLTAYDKMPDSFHEFVHVEYTMPATTVSHTTLRSISVNPCDDEPPEKYVKYSAKYDYKVKMRLSVNVGGSGIKGSGSGALATDSQAESSPIVIMKQPDLHDDLQREEDSDDSPSDEDNNNNNNNNQVDRD